jgi:hydrogenase maturation protease
MFEAAASWTPSPQPVLVLGLGNLLLRDEGVGIHVVRALARETLPDGVELCDGATAGMALVDLLAGREQVIVIDALDAGEPAGTVLRLDAEDLLAAPHPGCSVHELGLCEALAAARLLGVAPRAVVILGVQPAELTCGLELSAPLARLVPQITALVRAELDFRDPARTREGAVHA